MAVSPQRRLGLCWLRVPLMLHHHLAAHAVVLRHGMRSSAVGHSGLHHALEAQHSRMLVKKGDLQRRLLVRFKIAADGNLPPAEVVHVQCLQ